MTLTPPRNSRVFVKHLSCYQFRTQSVFHLHRMPCQWRANAWRWYQRQSQPAQVFWPGEICVQIKVPDPGVLAQKQCAGDYSSITSLTRSMPFWCRDLPCWCLVVLLPGVDHGVSDVVLPPHVIGDKHALEEQHWCNAALQFFIWSSLNADLPGLISCWKYSWREWHWDLLPLGEGVLTSEVLLTAANKKRWHAPLLQQRITTTFDLCSQFAR